MTSASADIFSDTEKSRQVFFGRFQQPTQVVYIVDDCSVGYVRVRIPNQFESKVIIGVLVIDDKLPSSQLHDACCHRFGLIGSASPLVFH